MISTEGNGRMLPYRVMAVPIASLLPVLIAAQSVDLIEGLSEG